MAQDLRNLFEDQSNDQHVKMPEGHEARFLQKLDKEMPQNKKSSHFGFLNIAASVILLLGLSYGAFKMFNDPVALENPVVTTESQKPELKTLGDLSPDLKKVEDYYLASINLELSKIELTPDNKELFDGYVLRLEELNKEYDKLTLELTENGANELTINALIDNLKFRLNLLYRLKDQLKELNEDSAEQA